ncbi:hypothetical protein Pmar_PMAR020704 [Perkinsus marinus ATCC 50983]|uniref:Uncharacterized protein n=1 Tax=Perkinsus marinus (strain ATCC 50983 / TXsc) TaxID=423536 RepID=C5L7S5_PERM5|nr:hypothetical protein Pmar_PMAR020704 [Perkinsus marinus ATCC 50983]EER07537.1 hypothetical protein Pmar_PMAR020704 [Perkinsus marinus ATCC 50983]|eukprot:XP_002775721.1 hypothetical protein Pmar_PMAR020704 [Perkinsus marinus ATCC 50983]
MIESSGIVLPPAIVPGGGKFSARMGGASVLLRMQPITAQPGDVLRWTFEMAPAGILHEDGGPVIQGRIPPRPKSRPFEYGYVMAPTMIGYRSVEDQPDANLVFSMPGTYKVFAWIQRTDPVTGVTIESR